MAVLGGWGSTCLRCFRRRPEMLRLFGGGLCCLGLFADCKGISDGAANQLLSGGATERFPSTSGEPGFKDAGSCALTLPVLTGGKKKSIFTVSIFGLLPYSLIANAPTWAGSDLKPPVRPRTQPAFPSVHRPGNATPPRHPGQQWFFQLVRDEHPAGLPALGCRYL